MNGSKGQEVLQYLLQGTFYILHNDKESIANCLSHLPIQVWGLYDVVR